MKSFYYWWLKQDTNNLSELKESVFNRKEELIKNNVIPQGDKKVVDSSDDSNIIPNYYKYTHFVVFYRESSEHLKKKYITPIGIMVPIYGSEVYSVREELPIFLDLPTSHLYTYWFGYLLMDHERLGMLRQKLNQVVEKAIKYNKEKISKWKLYSGKYVRDMMHVIWTLIKDICFVWDNEDISKQVIKIHKKNNKKAYEELMEKIEELADAIVSIKQEIWLDNDDIQKINQKIEQVIDGLKNMNILVVREIAEIK